MKGMHENKRVLCGVGIVGAKDVRAELDPYRALYENLVKHRE